MRYNFKLILVFLVLLSFIFPQKTYTFTEDEVKSLYTSIQELENTDSLNQKIIENLNSQIYMYIQSDSLYQSQIKDYKKQLELSQEMIKLVKPKWHENKYLWFFGGILITSGSVYLAGQIK